MELKMELKMKGTTDEIVDFIGQLKNESKQSNSNGNRYGSVGSYAIIHDNSSDIFVHVLSFP